MLTPEISVIVPAYNAAPFITDTLFSIYHQRAHVTPYEIIVVNDGSTDSTGAMLHGISKDLSRNLLRIIDQDNEGPSSAINKGINNARGRKILICDADDKLHPEAVEELAQALNETTFATAEKSGFEIRNSGTIFTYISSKVRLYKDSRRSDKKEDQYLFHANWISHPIAVTRSAIERIDGLDGSFHIAQDYDVALRLIYPRSGFNDFTSLGYVLYFHRYHPNSLSQRNRERQIREAETVINRTMERLGITKRAIADGRDERGLLYFRHESK